MRNDALPLFFSTCPSSTWQCPCSYLNSYGVFEERKRNCFATPPIFPRPCPMWFLFVSEIEIISCWTEIPVLTGTWICHSSVPYYCAQISVPWGLQEVDTLAETLHFQPGGVLRGHEMSTFGLTWNLKSPDRNKQFISNIPPTWPRTRMQMQRPTPKHFLVV